VRRFNPDETSSARAGSTELSDANPRSVVGRQPFINETAE